MNFWIDVPNGWTKGDASIYFTWTFSAHSTCHERLLKKLEAMNIGGKVLEWIRDWLSERRQRVRVEGEMSGWEAVVSSVIQGSVLGGTLFDIFINDIDMAATDALIKMFADDTKVAKIVETVEDGRRMQETVDSLAKWASKWK